MKTLSFPLYHGTSNLFEDKVKEFGLGGYNPIEKLKVINLFKELKAIADLHKIDNKDFAKQDELINQKLTMYQHGSVYLTPSPEQAKRYAYNGGDNKYGSEIFNELFKLVNTIEKNNIEIPAAIYNDNEYYKVMVTLKEKAFIRTRVYQLNNLTIADLLSTESGKDSIEDSIKEIENAIKEFGNGKSEFYDVTGVRNCFRLKNPFPWSKLMEI